MRIIAFVNQKGGVGKTTTTVNLAAKLAERGGKVILIDLDPQAHLTTFLGIPPGNIKRSSYSVLLREESLEAALIPVRDNIKLLASELNLAAAEQELVSVMGRETRLRDAIRQYSHKCDYVFIDCPPSLGLLTLNALGAAREVIIPLQAHFLSLQGLSQLLETLLLVQSRINPELKVSGLVFCMFDSRTTLSGEIVRDIEEFFNRQREQDNCWRDIRIFQTRIRRNVKLAESPSYGRTIFEYERNCHGAWDYNALADELEAMVTGEMETKVAGEDKNAVLPGQSSERQADDTATPDE
ncbi:MAG: ParA family protein, partial [Sedimentisphaerales bacterium]|nr:ParA family protein [Sedimentisphaerales bacterium]